MFEENKNNIEDLDFGFRSVLGQAQETVPAHVWDGVEAGLDRISQRRAAVLWFRRAAVGVAAAAAVTLGVFFGRGTDAELVAPASDSSMIAVADVQKVETVQEETASISDGAERLLAAAGKQPSGSMMTAGAEKYIQPAQEQEGGQETETADQEVAQPEQEVTQPEQEAGRISAEKEVRSESFPDVWPEDEVQRRKTGTSIVISGITGTNSGQNSHRVNPMKRPAVSAAPKKTGIKETSTNTIYGIPVSAGLGVRFDFNPKWSLGAGLNYTLLTRKFYGNYTRVGADGSILKDVSSDIRNSQHYIGIPVNVYYNIVSQDRINFYAYAGGTVEKCMADKYQVLNTDITHTEKVKGIQLSSNLGLGVEFMLGKHLGLYIDPSLRYYFNCGQPKSIRTAQPLTAGFEMGFRARL